MESFIGEKFDSIFEAAGVSIETMIELRHHLHSIPEGEFDCHLTHHHLKTTLLCLGIEEAQIKTSAKTGLIVDIQGKGPVSEEGEICSIAYRTDIDGLKIKENSDLPY